MEGRKRAARRCWNTGRAKKATRQGDGDILSQVYAKAGAVIGISFGAMLAIGILMGW